MKAPSIIKLDNLLTTSHSTKVEINGKWVPARPIGYPGLKHRFKCAWLAFSGKCDLVKWPKNQ